MRFKAERKRGSLSPLWPEGTVNISVIRLLNSQPPGIIINSQFVLYLGSKTLLFYTTSLTQLSEKQTQAAKLQQD